MRLSDAKYVQAMIKRKLDAGQFVPINPQEEGSPWCEVLIAELNDLYARAEAGERAWKALQELKDAR